MDYTNTADSLVRKRLIEASFIDGNAIKSELERYKGHGHHMQFKYGNRTDNLELVYLDWANGHLTNHVIKTNHYGKGYDSLNRIAKRFLGNMLCLEKDQCDSVKKKMKSVFVFFKIRGDLENQPKK